MDNSMGVTTPPVGNFGYLADCTHEAAVVTGELILNGM